MRPSGPSSSRRTSVPYVDGHRNDRRRVVVLAGAPPLDALEVRVVLRDALADELLPRSRLATVDEDGHDDEDDEQQPDDDPQDEPSAVHFDLLVYALQSIVYTSVYIAVSYTHLTLPTSDLV